MSKFRLSSSTSNPVIVRVGRALILLLLTFTFTSANAGAISDYHNMYVSLNLGYAGHDSAQFATEDIAGADFGVSGRFSFGYQPHPNFGIEISYSNFNLFNFSVEGVITGEGKHSAAAVSVGLKGFTYFSSRQRMYFEWSPSYYIYGYTGNSKRLSADGTPIEARKSGFSIIGIIAIGYLIDIRDNLTVGAEAAYFRIDPNVALQDLNTFENVGEVNNFTAITYSVSIGYWF